jgi:hypothetical protein
MTLIRKKRILRGEIHATCGDEQVSFVVHYRVLEKKETTKILGLFAEIQRTASDLKEQGKDDLAFLEATDKDGDPIIEVGAKILKKIICGWESYEDEDGNGVPFNEENLNELIDTDGIGEALLENWTDTIQKVKAKNSQSLPNGAADP